MQGKGEHVGAPPEKKCLMINFSKCFKEVFFHLMFLPEKLKGCRGNLSGALEDLFIFIFWLEELVNLYFKIYK